MVSLDGGSDENDKVGGIGIAPQFNDLFGKVAWNDADKIRQMITVEIPEQLVNNATYQNSILHSERQNAQIEHNKVLQEILLAYLKDHTQLYGQYSDNLSFQKWLQETMFGMTYKSTQVDINKEV